MSGALGAAVRVGPVLERLRLLHPKVIDLSLERILRLLEALGNPHRRLPPVIHVAGTNGKGSVVAFVRAMLEASGRRVHVYTSPHLVRFNERIRLAGTLIADAPLLALLEECEAANRGLPITQFEIITAAALLAFAREPADVVVLETGLGGRLDATNVIERPAATAITRISHDHHQFLGETLAEIAAEKAGILKPGVKVVLAPQPSEEVTATLLVHVERVGAVVHPWTQTSHPDGGFCFEGSDYRLDLPAPGLLGRHQMVNAAQALACLECLAEYQGEIAIPEVAVRRGLAMVEWPARLQRLTCGPLVERLPPGWELWLDGGHNDSAGEVLAEQAAVWCRAKPSLPLALVFGMLSSKRPREFLAPLVPWAERVCTVPVPGEEASLTPAAAAEAAHDAGIATVFPVMGPVAALDELVHLAPEPMRVLICGSLYLAGAVLAENG
ncbi:dihydrofolate synthase / folylpolyglutamate synthase [uncultured Gammaproteobacteria bacterium]